MFHICQIFFRDATAMTNELFKIYIQVRKSCLSKQIYQYSIQHKNKIKCNISNKELNIYLLIFESIKSIKLVVI